MIIREQQSRDALKKLAEADKDSEDPTCFFSNLAEFGDLAFEMYTGAGPIDRLRTSIGRLLLALRLRDTAQRNALQILDKSHKEGLHLAPVARPDIENTTFMRFKTRWRMAVGEADVLSASRVNDLERDALKWLGCVIVTGRVDFAPLEQDQLQSDVSSAEVVAKNRAVSLGHTMGNLINDL